MTPHTSRLDVAVNHQLRPAAECDKAFLYELHRTTMRVHIEEAWGWDEAWQRLDFEKRFGQYDVSVIDVEGQAAGALWLGARIHLLYVADLQIMPEWQNRGIGTAVLRGVMAQASARGVAVELATLPSNDRARRLYERLGFQVTRFGTPFIHLRYEPPDQRSPA